MRDERKPKKRRKNNVTTDHLIWMKTNQLRKLKYIIEMNRDNGSNRKPKLSILEIIYLIKILFRELFGAVSVASAMK